jgi:hypothetical protein
MNNLTNTFLGYVSPSITQAEALFRARSLIPQPSKKESKVARRLLNDLAVNRMAVIGRNSIGATSRNIDVPIPDVIYLGFHR